jgi:hypothetical protein
MRVPHSNCTTTGLIACFSTSRVECIVSCGARARVNSAVMSPRTKLTIFFLLLSGPVLWFLGGYLQRIYGLDPPYAIFYLGFFMQPIGVFCMMAALIVAAIHQFRKRAKGDEGV